MTPEQLEKFSSQQPQLTKRQCGGWLASTTDRSPIAFTTEGDTEAEARAEFGRLLVVWRQAYERYRALRGPVTP